jgi:hypothetical protein
MLFIYDDSVQIWHCFCAIFTMFPIRFFYNKACNWNIEFLQIVNISKLYHILGSNHSTFYVWSFQVSFPYNFLVLKMWTLLFTKYMWKTITFHCLPSSRCNCWTQPLTLQRNHQFYKIEIDLGEIIDQAFINAMDVIGL